MEKCSRGRVLIVSLAVLTVLCLVGSGPRIMRGQTARRSRTPAAKPAMMQAAMPAKAGARPKFKAIWEPVSYKEDLELMDALFVSDQEGWVAGGAGVMKGGVILHTKDGGRPLGGPTRGPSVRRPRFSGSALR